MKKRRSFKINTKKAFFLLPLFSFSLFFIGFPPVHGKSASDIDLEGAIYGHRHRKIAKPKPVKHAVKRAPDSLAKKDHAHPKPKPQAQALPASDKKHIDAHVTLPPAPVPQEQFSPHFAALRSNKVYMRRGPGVNYPIDWVYYRRGLPVKVTREFQNWCQVEDSFGEKGWMHKATLRNFRAFVVVAPKSVSEKVKLPQKEEKADLSKQYDSQVIRYCTPSDKRCAFESFPIYSAPDSKEPPVALLLPGAVGRIIRCDGDFGAKWCEVSVAGYKGWIERTHLWGALDSDLAPSKDRKRF